MNDTKGSYQGEERRQDYCPVHHIKCAQWESTDKLAKSRVPIWVFVIFVSLAGGFFSWINKESVTRHETAVKLIQNHVTNANSAIENQNRILKSLVHGYSEVALNQRAIQKKLEMPFQHIPKYDDVLPRR